MSASQTTTVMCDTPSCDGDGFEGLVLAPELLEVSFGGRAQPARVVAHPRAVGRQSELAHDGVDLWGGHAEFGGDLCARLGGVLGSEPSGIVESLGGTEALTFVGSADWNPVAVQGVDDARGCDAEFGGERAGRRLLVAGGEPVGVAKLSWDLKRSAVAAVADGDVVAAECGQHRAACDAEFGGDRSRRSAPVGVGEPVGIIEVASGGGVHVRSAGRRCGHDFVSCPCARVCG